MIYLLNYALILAIKLQLWIKSQSGAYNWWTRTTRRRFMSFSLSLSACTSCIWVFGHVTFSSSSTSLSLSSEVLILYEQILGMKSRPLQIYFSWLAMRASRLVAFSRVLRLFKSEVWCCDLNKSAFLLIKTLVTWHDMTLVPFFQVSDS